MKQGQKKPVSIVYRMIQDAIRKERRGWPPESDWGIYQPQRPKTSADDEPAQVKQ